MDYVLDDKSVRNMMNRVVSLRKKGADLTNMFGAQVYVWVDKPPYGRWILKPDGPWVQWDELVFLQARCSDR